MILANLGNDETWPIHTDQTTTNWNQRHVVVRSAQPTVELLLIGCFNLGSLLQKMHHRDLNWIIGFGTLSEFTDTLLYNHLNEIKVIFSFVLLLNLSVENAIV